MSATVTFALPAPSWVYMGNSEPSTFAEPSSDMTPSAGSPEEQFFRQHYPGIVASAQRVLGDQGEGEEIAVTVFSRFFREKPSCDSAIAWLKHCAFLLALDRLRANHRRRRRERLAPTVGPTVATPEEALLLAERKAQVRFVLAEMAPRDAALLLARAEGHSYQELAMMLQLKTSSVGTLLARAEKKFEERYKKRYAR
jgi:RNA polymerase sigma factor (sigma-70 family)